MSEKEFFEKNLVLTTKFDRYILEHPEVAEQIPLNAQIVLLPEDDPEFYQKNREVAAAQQEAWQPVVYVHRKTCSPTLAHHQPPTHGRGGLKNTDLIKEFNRYIRKQSRFAEQIPYDAGGSLRLEE